MSTAAAEDLPAEGGPGRVQGQREECGSRGVPGPSETELRTLDLDTVSSHCPLLSLFYQAPAVHGLAAQASGEPRAEPPSSLVSSPVTVVAGTESGTKGTLGPLAEVQPGATPAPPISTDCCWGPQGYSPGRAAWPPRSPAASCPGVLKGLPKLMLRKPRAEGRSLSSLGLCGWLNRPQPLQLERPHSLSGFGSCQTWFPPWLRLSVARRPWQDYRSSPSPAPGTQNALNRRQHLAP